MRLSPLSSKGSCEEYMINIKALHRFLPVGTKYMISNY